MSVGFETRDGVAWVRLNRPDKLNALTPDMLAELAHVFANIESERKVRAVILTGAGLKAFSAGTDINYLQALDIEAARDAAVRGQEVYERIENCGVPVIAALDGVVAGGGCELALACHLRIASTRAHFSLPETRLGLIPAYGATQRLARIVGQGRALEMMLTGAQVVRRRCAARGACQSRCLFIETVG